MPAQPGFELPRHPCGSAAPRGNGHPNVVPYQAFPSSDGHAILAVGNGGQFARFRAEADRPDLAADERCVSNAQRVRNRATLIPELRRVTVQRSTADWIAALERCGVPCGPINNLEEVFADPQVRARGMGDGMPEDELTAIPQVASPIRLSATPVTYLRPPPRLGGNR